MAPLQGAKIFIRVLSGGLHCAATTGYFRSTLWVEISASCYLLLPPAPGFVISFALPNASFQGSL